MDFLKTADLSPASTTSIKRESMSTERREQERFFLNLQARISAERKDSLSPLIETVAANISAGGAFLTTDHIFPIASKVRMEFLVTYDDLKKLRFILSYESLKKLSDNKVWINATGIVIRREAQGVAVIFETNYQLTPLKPPL
jgi:c-di-GMP-binding flagellar brake protein YcgR